MNPNPSWFPSPSFIILCESFSEWQERCATDFVQNTSTTWYSVLFRLHSWAHSQNSSSVHQQESLIASPWSRAPPRMKPATTNQHQQENDEEEIINRANNNNTTFVDQQQQQQDAGLIVRPIVWLLFVKNNNTSTSEEKEEEFKLVHMNCAPPDLAREIDSEYFSLVDLGQWHAGQLAKILDHTPSGRYPETIILDAKLSSSLTCNEVEKDEEQERNARCSKFARQAQDALQKIEKEKNVKIVDANNNNDDHQQQQAVATIQSLLQSFCLYDPALQCFLVLQMPSSPLTATH